MKKLVLLICAIFTLATTAMAAQETLVKTDTLSAGFTHGDVRTLMDANTDSANNNFTELYNEAIDVTDYGAIAGDGIDDLSAFTAAVTAAIASDEKKIIKLPGGVFDLSGTWQVPLGISLIGDAGATEVRTMSGGVYVGGFLLRTNRTVADYSRDDSDITRQGVFIRNIKFSNVNAESSHNYGIYVGDKRELSGLTFQYFWKAIAWTTEYTDVKYISRTTVYMSKSDGTDGYMVDMGSMGDGLHIDGLSISYRNDGSVLESDRLALRINASLGGVLQNSIINGQLYVLKSDGVTIQNCHFEIGGILTRPADFLPILFDSNQNIVFRDSYIMVGSDLGLKITRDVTEAKGTVSLENLSFVHVIRADYDYENSGDDLSVQGQLVEIKNCFRSYTVDNVAQAAATGITVLNGASGLLLDEFNNRSYILSQHSYIRYTTVLDYSSVIAGSSGTPGAIIANLAANSSIDWRIATGVYYYRAAIIYDPVRMLGHQGDTEVSLPLTLNSDGARFTLDPSNGYELPAILRVYRGTASGVFEKYVDIPAIYAREFYDNGTSLNGYSWEDNLNASDIVDYLNDLNQRLEITKDRTVAYVTTPVAPTYGTWKQGDEIRDISPTAGPVVVYSATTTGTPGVWRESSIQRITTLESYGAIGDGVTDDTSAITAAFAYAAAHGTEVIAAPNKNYLFTTTVSVAASDIGAKGFKFSCASSTESCNFTYTGTGYAFEFTGTGTESETPFRELEILNIKVTGGASNTTSAGGIYIDRAFMATLDNVISTAWAAAGAHALEARNVFNFSVRGGQFANGSGTTPSGGSSIVVGSKDSGAGDEWNSSNISFRDSLIQYGGAYGIEIQHDGNVLDALLIENCSFGKNATGSFYADNANVSNVTFLGNHFESGGYNGTGISAGSFHIKAYNIDGLVIANNNFKDTVTHIDVDSVSGCAIYSNKIYESGTYTIASTVGISVGSATSTATVNIGANEIWTSQIDTAYSIDVVSHVYHTGGGVLETAESTWSTEISPNPAEYQNAIINRSSSTGAPYDQMYSPDGANWMRVLLLNRITADPCATATEGTPFYNDTSDYWCFCTGAGVDVQLHDPATACF